MSRVSGAIFALLWLTVACQPHAVPAASSSTALPASPRAEPFSVALEGQVATVGTCSGWLRVSSPAAGVFRVRLSRDARFEPELSFAVEPELAEQASALEVTQAADSVLLATEHGALQVAESGRFQLLDGSGRVVGGGAGLERQHAGRPALLWELEPGTRVFGAGDKAKGMDRRGKSFEFWNYDSYGWDVQADPLYKSLPFFLLLGASGTATGLFVDNAARAHADVGKARSAELRYELDTEHADDLTVYVFTGSEPRSVLERFTGLTGRMPLPPKWALGYHQSRYGYKTEREIRDIVARFRREQIPLDAIWLDIDFQEKNAPFTVDRKAFPDFAGMLEDFRKTGTRTVVITDPHIAFQTRASSGYAPFDSGMAGDHFILAPSGQGPFVAPVWPGKSVFPEFTREKTRAWWGGLYRDFVAQGVAGFWNDMNEPATFNESKTFPPTVQHRLDDGSRVPHVLVHNAYGTLNVRATYEGVRALRPEARPFVLTRAASVGAQRFAASWTGDNRASWEHLRASIAQLTNLGVSGFAFVGADVGGFVGCPEPELLSTWMQVGAFQPFFRNHAAHDACAREPWVHGGEWQAIMKRAIERRYRWMPYLYTVFEESARTGAPVMRPLWFEFPGDPSVLDESSAFLVGSALLVAPRLSSGSAAYPVQLPHADWYDTETGELIVGGGQVLVQAGAEDEVRVFVRAGSIVPEMPVVQHAAEGARAPLSLHVWWADSCQGALYDDDGESFGYSQGDFQRLAFACQRQGDTWRLSARSTGKITPSWRGSRVVLHGAPRELKNARDSRGKRFSVRHDKKKETLEIDLEYALADFELHLSR